MYIMGLLGAVLLLTSLIVGWCWLFINTLQNAYDMGHSWFEGNETKARTSGVLLAMLQGGSILLGIAISSHYLLK